jgi:riboflavin synthase
VFTGIIEEVGVLGAARERGGSRSLDIRARKVLQGTKIGDSIAVDGVCLTVSSLSPDGFSADAVSETLSRTTLAEAAPGTAVNLERALTPTTRLGGHFVQGHVDGMGVLLQMGGTAGDVRARILAPEGQEGLLAPKGSVAVQGVSLTIVDVVGREFSVALVPHTLRATNLASKRPGDRLNIETDVLAKYVARLLAAHPGESRVTLEFLTEHGFVRSGFGESDTRRLRREGA